MIAAEQLVSELGAQPVRLDAEEHDRTVAFTSHLPQMLSTALALTVGSQALAGPALRDMTRLAASSPLMWKDIFETNADNVSAALRDIIGQIETLADLLEAGELDAIEQRMLLAQQALFERSEVTA